MTKCPLPREAKISSHRRQAATRPLRGAEQGDRWVALGRPLSRFAAGAMPHRRQAASRPLLPFAIARCRRAASRKLPFVPSAAFP